MSAADTVQVERLGEVWVVMLARPRLYSRCAGGCGAVRRGRL